MTQRTPGPTGTTSPGEPLGLSTSWNGAGGRPPAVVLDEHQRLGFRRLEAYCHWLPDDLRALAAQARARGVEIGSLHGPCPVALDANGARGTWGDPLASTDEGQRLYAVDVMRRSIDAAAEVGARAIVVHLGTTGAPSRQREVFACVEREGRGSDAHRRLLDQARAERARYQGPALDAALRTIRALGEHAVGTGVTLGVEVRDGYVEIPDLDEIGAVLEACEGLPVGYWHGAGHGAKLAYGGFVDEHEAYLRRYGERLVGMHVHDTDGPRDHLAPGQGQTDFAMLARYLRPEVLKTLELNPRVTPEEITRAVDLLRPLGAFGVDEGVVYEA